MTRPSRQPLWIALPIWAAVATGVCLVWGVGVIDRSRANFEREVRILQGVLTQRVEQHEGVLSSLEALVMMRLGSDQLQTYATAIRARYPQITAIEYCATQTARTACANPRVLAGTVPHDVTARQRALEVALNGPGASITALEAPVFALSQAFTVGTTRHVFTLWIDGSRWLRTDERPSPDVAFRVMHATNGQTLFAPETTAQTIGLEARLLPRFTLDKRFGSASQPYTLRGERQFRALELPVLPMLAFLIGSAGLAGVAVRVVQGLQRAQNARRQAEAALSLERVRAQGTVQSVSDAIIAFGQDGVISLVNPAAQTLLGNDPTGKPVQNVIQLKATLSQRPLDDVFKAFWLEPHTTELPEGTALVDTNGQERLIEGTLSPLHDEHGRVSGAVFTCRDLGPFRRRMLEALEASEQRLREHEAMLAHVARVSTTGEIASGIAHELNQPLTAILSHAQASLRLLEETEPDLIQVRRSLGASAEQAKRAGEIIRRMRALVTKTPLRREPTDLIQLWRNVRVLTEHELRQAGIALRLQLPETPLRAEADAIQLEQVMHNLVRNAIEALEHLPASQRILEIAAGQNGNALWFRVRDHGPGIAPEILPRLFAPFTTSKASGMGLGLSLSLTLMQGMGGTLTAENHPDGGASFSLHLPALAPTPVGHAQT